MATLSHDIHQHAPDSHVDSKIDSKIEDEQVEHGSPVATEFIETKYAGKPFTKQISG
jgi:hypothetical protein